MIAMIFPGPFAFLGISQSREFKKYPRVDFEKVRESELDTLVFTGTVKSIYQCPPCPPGVHCKPCIGDHILVTNGNSEMDFRVFTHQLSLFTVGKPYDFIVHRRWGARQEDNIELVMAKKRKIKTAAK